MRRAAQHLFLSYAIAPNRWSFGTSITAFRIMAWQRVSCDTRDHASTMELNDEASVV